MAGPSPKVLALAHSKAARKKAAQTQRALADVRQQMAERYGATPSEFMKARLLDTCKRYGIPMSEVPELLLKPFSPAARRALMSKGNGHDRSVGIPLDAIPERASKTSSSPSRARGRGSHPNGDLIEKILDLLASPQIDKQIAERLLAALDKLT